MSKQQLVTLGEIMLRLKSPGTERFFQSPLFEAAFGGGESNVAVSVSRFGIPVRFVTALPDNVLGDQVLAELRQQAVDISNIIRHGERLGIYYLESGANQRPGRVVYDRAGSSIATAEHTLFDWDSIFTDTTWFHITGITPALSETAAELSLKAVSEAKKRSIIVSLDLNFRKKLWKYGKDAPRVMPELVRFSDIVIANEEDCQRSLGISVEDINVKSGHLRTEHFRTLSENVMKLYPNIQKTAITMRESISADHNNWSAVVFNGSDFFVSSKYEIRNIVDRIGGGDSFAAGLIYGLMTFATDREALEFAVAASCLKHSIPGDRNLVTRDEVFALMKGDSSGRVQR